MGSANPNRRSPVNSVGTAGARAPVGRFALVVSASRINTIVVSRIVQDCGIKPVVANVAEAIPLLEETSPLLIILEGQLEAEGMSPFLDDLAFKQGSGSAPPTIYLTSDGTYDPTAYRFSAVVKMPVTSETLRPVIDRLAVERHQGSSKRIVNK